MPETDEVAEVERMEVAEPPPEPELPPGDYAVVELFGHVRLVGRVSDVERFGAKMLGLEVIWEDRLLPMSFYGGGALYGVTPCSPAAAQRAQVRSRYALPEAIRDILPAGPLRQIPPPSAPPLITEEGDEDERPF